MMLYLSGYRFIIISEQGAALWNKEKNINIGFGVTWVEIPAWPIMILV